VPLAAAVVSSFEAISDALRHLLAKSEAGLGAVALHSRRLLGDFIGGIVHVG
jgi:hypothetical protein